MNVQSIDMEIYRLKIIKASCYANGSDVRRIVNFEFCAIRMKGKQMKSKVCNRDK